jgi:hypothetical protein
MSSKKVKVVKKCQKIGLNAGTSTVMRIRCGEGWGGAGRHQFRFLSRRRLFFFISRFFRLHGWQAGTRLSAVLLPPRLSGTTWSICDGPGVPQ